MPYFYTSAIVDYEYNVKSRSYIPKYYVYCALFLYLSYYAHKVDP